MISFRRLAAVALGCALLVAVTAAPVQATQRDGRATVVPTVRITGPIPAQYLTDTTVTWQVRPASYAGAVSVVNRSGTVLGRATAAAGTVTIALQAPVYGRAPVTVRLAAVDGFKAASQPAMMIASAPRLVDGSRDAIVPALLRKLASLKYHTPRLTNRYSKRVSDVVLAFQKVTDLPRTATVGPRTWRALSASGPVLARRGGSGVHLEVDKTRQVLKLVQGRVVIGTIHVSTGATGNTPVGRFQIYSKGGSYLYRWMAFKGNFGIHGYVPVPKFPASHGCVREPMWTADWTYHRTKVGTRLYIYN